MAFVIGRMPANLWLVFATRMDPICRWLSRHRGDLVEMRATIYVSGLLRRASCRTMCRGWTYVKTGRALSHAYHRWRSWARKVQLNTLCVALITIQINAQREHRIRESAR